MLPSNNFQQTEQRVFFYGTIWALAIAFGGLGGVFTHLPLPSIAFLVVVSLTALLVLYYRNRDINNLLASLNPRNLIVFHLWRIVAGFTFLYYGSQSLLPERFVINAGYGDLAVGLLVPIILLGGESTRKYIAFHLFSLLDFVVAVGTGLTFTLAQVPSMENIATFPIVLIPLFGVPLTGASSIIAIDSIIKYQRQHTNS